MRWKRAVSETRRHVQPCFAVRLHDEWVVPREGILGLGIGRGNRVRPLVHVHVRHVGTRPPVVLLVPPHILLAFRPRLPIGVGRGAVVQDATVGRPCPSPFGGHPVLLRARPTTAGLVDALCVATAVDPTTTPRRPVVLELGVGAQRLAVRVRAIDLGQHRLSTRVVVNSLERVLPGEVEHRAIARISRAGQSLTHEPAEVVEKPQIGARIARRLHRLVVPLQQTLRLGERAALFGVRGSRHQEHLRGDVLGAQLATRDLGSVVPEGCRLGLLQVSNHQPIELGHRLAVHPAVGGADGGVLSQREEALHPTVEHPERRLIRGVIAGEAWQVVEAEVVLRSRSIAEPRLQEADRVLAHVAPVAAARCVGEDEVLE